MEECDYISIFLAMPLSIASYQFKEIIDNTIAEFEKNKLKTLINQLTK